MVIPIFYEVDPSHVRKQTGDFGKAFEITCEGKAEDHIERWKKALAKVAGLAGYDSQNWNDEAEAIELISTDVSNKLLLAPLDDFRDFVGMQAHVKTIMDSKLCLDSGGVRMVGIWGPSGIGKSTIATALFNRLSSTQFDHRAFLTYKRAMQDKKIADVRMKLDWANHFLSEILGQKDIKIASLGQVEQRLKHRKVLIVLDDVDEIELLEALVGKPEWFGSGSRIIVVTQDKALLESHGIDVIYEVELPSEDLALQIFCQSAFGQTSTPDGFKELAVEVAKLAGDLPLGLNTLGSSLRKKRKEHWVDMMPRLRSGLDGKIKKTLRLCYDGLDEKDDQDIFVYIACLFNGESANHIKNLLADSVYPSVSASLTTLADKSLIRIIGPHHIVQMHILLQKLGRQIVREESIPNPGKRRFLVNAKEICDVFNESTGTKKVLGIHLDTSEICKPLFIDEKSFSGKNLVELRMEDSKLEKLWEGSDQPSRSLKVINLSRCGDLKEIPDLSNATNLEILNLRKCSSLVTLPSSIRNLKKLRELEMFLCSNLEVLPTDANLDSLDYLDLSACSRLRTFPRISRNISRLYLDGTAMEEEDCLWIENLSGLTELYWENCPLRFMPSNFNPELLVRLTMTESKLEKLWEGVQSLTNLTWMDLSNCESLKEIPDLSKATNLVWLDLSGCKNLKVIPGCNNVKEIPNLSNPSNLEKLVLDNCTSLVKLPSSIRHLDKLEALSMIGCTSLEDLPTNINLESLTSLNLSGCSRLTSFPQFSMSIKELHLRDTAIEEVPSWIENIAGLSKLWMSGCTSLEDLPTNINLESLTSLDLSGCSRLKTFPQFSRSIQELDLSETAIEEVPSWIENIAGLTSLEMSRCEKLKIISANLWSSRPIWADFTDCGAVTSVSDATPDETMHSYSSYYDSELLFHNCFNLDQDAQKSILQSDFSDAILPGKEVPTYFTHRARGSSLTFPLPQSSLSQKKFHFTAYIIPDLATDSQDYCKRIIVHWRFRGVEDAHQVELGISAKMDHLVAFHFYIFFQEDPPSQLDCDNVELEFKLHFGFSVPTISLLPIKECGVRFLDASDRRSETESTYQSEESDEETERSKKRMRMTVETSGENSNSLSGQTGVKSGSMSLNLALSLGLVGAPPHASSRSKVPSPSTSSTPSLNLSLSPSDPCLERESLYFDPMITEHEDTRTPNEEDTLSSPQLLNSFQMM
ncbi:hypothetical protein AALP_AA8G289500 [Arabis alpina]|uniref:ADP-ribosyl cyclase/cyclic ADP-ribose hydrolase n=1 Tax=Arabis alpina TaxID=50452 RepID=A0A087GA55_ARAAL|nr:hypothetical protein AALP_AA8G289500 [Arabis alpina]